MNETQLNFILARGVLSYSWSLTHFKNPSKHNVSRMKHSCVRRLVYLCTRTESACMLALMSIRWSIKARRKRTCERRGKVNSVRKLVSVLVRFEIDKHWFWDKCGCDDHRCMSDSCPRVLTGRCRASRMLDPSAVRNCRPR